MDTQTLTSFAHHNQGYANHCGTTKLNAWNFTPNWLTASYEVVAVGILVLGLHKNTRSKFGKLGEPFFRDRVFIPDLQMREMPGILTRTNSEALPRLAPKIYRFTDLDQYRTAVRNLEVEFTPLVRRISAEQIILNLPGCDINFAKSFPRIADGRLAQNCTAIGISMDDGVPIRFNGVARDRSAIAIGSDGAAYTTVERTERHFASIIFTQEIRDRGWPETGPNWKVFETSAAAQHWLRELVRQVLSVSPTFDACEAVSFSIRESLLAGIDAAFAHTVDASWASRANSVRHFNIYRNTQAVLSGNIGRPIYSEELARQVGVSVRSMQAAVQRYQGMSLHRYLRLRRLWLVRQRLLAGTDSVKASALAFGFWHLGDFARSYRLHFGETPSTTLAKSHQR